jgi:hypothetical protein
MSVYGLVDVMLFWNELKHPDYERTPPALPSPLSDLHETSASRVIRVDFQMKSVLLKLPKSQDLVPAHE